MLTTRIILQILLNVFRGPLQRHLQNVVEKEKGKRGINFSFYDRKNYYYYDNDDNDNTNVDSGYDDNIGKDGQQMRKNGYSNTYYNEDTFSSTSLFSSPNEYGHEDQNELDYDGYTDHISSQPAKKHQHNRGDGSDNSYGNSRSNYNDNSRSRSSSRDIRKDPHASSYSDNSHDEINANTS